MITPQTVSSVQLPQASDSVNFGDRLQSSFSQVFGQLALPLLGALVILFAGYLLAKVLEKLTERLLRRIRLNYLLERGGVTQAVERSGTHVNPTRVISNLVFWLVMFTVILLAANALGLQSLANVVSNEVDVRGVLAKLDTGDADAGIVYTTDAQSAGTGINTIAIPTQLNVLATYPIAVVRGSPAGGVARAFVRFVLGPGQLTLRAAGFLRP